MTTQTQTQTRDEALREARHTAIEFARKTVEENYGVDLSRDGDAELRWLVTTAACAAMGAYDAERDRL